MTDTTLTFEQAVEALPVAESIHTFLNNIGANWPAEDVVSAIALAGRENIRVAGPLAQAMGHGLAIPHPRAPEKWLLIKTRHRTDGGQS